MAITLEEQALARLQRLNSDREAQQKEKQEDIELLLELDAKRRAADDKMTAFNVALEQELLERAKPQADKSETKTLAVEPLPEFGVHSAFVQRADGTIVSQVNYRYERPKDEAAEIASTATMADSLTEMKQHSATHLKLEPARLAELELDEASVVYHDDHMSAALKDGTRFTHRNHSHDHTSSIEYHLPEVCQDDLLAQAMRIGNISALLAMMNHQKTEHGRWHKTRPVMVQEAPKVIDQHVSLYALAKSFEIFQLGHMGYKMMNHMQQELSFEDLKHNTHNLTDYIHQKGLGLSFKQ